MSMKERLKPELKELAPLQKNSRVLLPSKAGNYSWRAKWEGRDVKIYETSSPTHADYIKAVSAHESVCKCLPECCGTEGSRVIAEWVIGRAVSIDDFNSNQELLESFVGFQATLHRIEYSARGEPNCYYLDFLLDRVERFGLLQSRSPSLTRYRELLDSSREEPSYASHPDLTPRNLVVSRDLRLVSIDNELLSPNPLYHIDLYSTLYGFCAEEENAFSRRYLQLYLDRHQGELSSEELEKIDLVWRLRLSGSAFQCGDFETGHAILAESGLTPLGSIVKRMLG